jgi:hypothetical protein
MIASGLPRDLNRFGGMVVKIHREIKARRQSTISRWSVLETVSGSFGYHWRRAF